MNDLEGGIMTAKSISGPGFDLEYFRNLGDCIGPLCYTGLNRYGICVSFHRTTPFRSSGNLADPILSKRSFMILYRNFIILLFAALSY